MTIVPDVLRGTSSLQRSPTAAVKLFCVLEGANDIEFLLRISQMMTKARPGLPDLRQLQRSGEMAILPRCGGDLLVWAERLAPLGANQFHLADREIPPECHLRRQAARIIDRRDGCGAAITRKRALENYLHPAAIYEARGVEVEFGDEDDVADIVACRLFAARTPAPSWEQLPVRARKRLRNRVKKWLNTDAVDRMTYERLSERDGAEEIASWLSKIRELLAAS
jgi:hypothetical protein